MKEPDAGPDPWWAKLVSLMLGLLLLGGLELGARLVHTPGHLDRILALLRQDSRLFWRNRPGLDTRFFGAAVRTDGRGFRIGPPGRRAATGSPLVVCMGASPTFGWGVPQGETYCNLLQKALSKGLGRSVTTLNAGMIGHTSHQGRLLLLSDLLRLRPALVTVPYVINDIDRYRFFRSNGRPDRLLSPRSPTVVGMRNLLGRSMLARMLVGALRGAVTPGTPMRGNPMTLHRPMSVRVPPADYRANLRAMLKAIRRQGGVGLLLVMPVNLPPAPVVDPASRRAAARLIERGRAALGSRRYARALRLFQDGLGKDPWSSDAGYHVGLARQKLGDRAGAQRAYARAFKIEAGRCGRVGRDYNRAMKDLGRELGAPVVDLAAAFRAQKGRELFLTRRRDPLHPNVAGHRLAARTIAGKIISAGLLKR